MTVEELILLLEDEEERISNNPDDITAKTKYNYYYDLILRKQNEKDHLSS